MPLEDRKSNNILFHEQYEFFRKCVKLRILQKVMRFEKKRSAIWDILKEISRRENPPGQSMGKRMNLHLLQVNNCFSI